MISGLIFEFKFFEISGDLLELIRKFLSNRFQRVVVNGKTSELENVNAGVPNGSILGLLIFLIYVNHLSDGITSLLKLFADGTSLFSVIQNKNDSASQLNNNLDKVITWKITFNLRNFKEVYKWGSSSHKFLIIRQSPRIPLKNILGCILL